jgi:hypothetical protein
MDNQNRRRTQRISVKVHVVVESGEAIMIPGYTDNVSLSGLFLTCVVRPPVGTVCDVKIYVPDGKGEKVVDAIARIARVSDEGMGLEFTAVQGLGRRTLERLTEVTEDSD